MIWRLGALIWIVWGMIHIAGGSMGIILSFPQDFPAPPNALSIFNPVNGYSNLDHPVIAVGQEYNANAILIGILVSVVAIIFNWRNSITGWWVNAAVISILEISFITFRLIPGHVPLEMGLVGPTLWVGGLVLVTLGVLDRDRRTP